MAFRALKQVPTHDFKYALIDNSQTLSIGEAVIPAIQGDTSVLNTAGGTTGAVLGVVVGFKSANGASLEYNTIAAENDNVTDKMIYAAYIPSFIPMEYEVDLDAAAETTDNSGAFGNFAIDSTGLLADESTYVAFSTIEDKQLFSYGLTGKDTTQISCVIISKPLGYNIA